MFDKVLKWYYNANPMFLFLVLFILCILSYVFSWSSLILFMVLIVLHSSYWIVVKVGETGSKIEPEDDPSGNSNISKKFIDHM